MKANLRFSNQTIQFWGAVRFISQECGYTKRSRTNKKSYIKVPTIEEIIEIYNRFEFNIEDIVFNEKLTYFGNELLEYFKYRADILNNVVEKNLMNLEQAKKLFNSLKTQRDYLCPFPMNKQKNEKRDYALFTCIINMLIEKTIENKFPCDYDPKKLTTFYLNEQVYHTLSRRVDGAFPQTINPIAIWEIKEYYYTTTFGSRVADGIYETLLDGMELKYIKDQNIYFPQHYLMIDAHYTWWQKGKSYLCRIIDMLNMGYVDEVLVGKEVYEKIPEIFNELIIKYQDFKS